MKEDKTKTDKGDNQPYGTLYVVATPIGNLEDITLRALKILKNTGLIAAENTNHTRSLCNHYGISVKLTSYNQHNRKSKGPRLIEMLKKGLDIALVTNAGTPVVSDPGSLLINMAHEEGIRVSPIPGPSAAVTALSVCGLKVDRFIFLGFLPNKEGKRRKYLKELRHEQRTMIIYEAPHRIRSLLNDLKEAFGDRPIVILRELTKIFEEIKRGSISHMLQDMDDDKIKGEFTLILAGDEKDDEKQNETRDIDIKKRIQKLLRLKKTGAKDIATRLSSELGINYRIIYKECLNIMKEMNS